MAGERDDDPTPEDDELAQLELPKLFRRRKRTAEAETGADDGVSTSSTSESEASPPATPEPDPAPHADPTTETTEVDPVEPPAAAPGETQEAATTEVEPVETTTEVEPVETLATESRSRRLFRRPGRKAPQPQTEEQVSTSSTSGVEAENQVSTSSTSGVEAENQVSTSSTPEVEAENQVSTSSTPEAEAEPGRATGALHDDTTTATTEVEPVETTTWEPSAPTEPEPEPEPKPEPEPEPAGPSLADRLAAVRLPDLAGHLAAAVVGAVVGLVGVGLVVGAESGCQAVRGSDNCGSAGLFLIIGVAVLMVVLGALGLAAWRQESALSTSFLGVGLLAVIVMLLLLPVIFSWWMVLVMPVVGAATFTLSWWVSNRVGPEARRINDEYSPETHR